MRDAPALLLLAACGKGPFEAPSTAGIDIPDDIQIAWSERYQNFHDGLGFILFASPGVYDEGTNEANRLGMPLENIEMEVYTGYMGVCIVPNDALLTRDPPERPDDWEENYEEYCYNENGEFDPSENEWCAWLLDDDSGYYYQITGEYADGDGYCPTMYRGATDGHGRMDVVLYVDSMPENSDGEFTDVPIFVSISVETDSFNITTGS